jgi:uncharacterized caspase-like protein
MARGALSAFFGTCLAALGLSSTAALAEKKVALIIGNSAYESVGKLPNPANDATAVAKMFQNAGFEVLGRRDLGNVEFRRTIREFTFKARGADIAVVFFAGHGIEVKGTNYLIPTDAKLVTDFDASDEAISLDRILESIDSVKRLRLVILDACRDNPFERKIVRNSSTRAVARGLAEVGIGAGNMLVAYAAKAGSTADDGSGEHSPFTTALLKHLAVPGLDVRLAMGRVRDEVLQSTNNRQEPFTYGSLGGAELFIVPPPAKPKIEEAPPAPNLNAEVRRDYELAMQLGSKEAWEAFLAQHPTGGLYATFAKQQLARLNAPVASPAEPAQPNQENLTWERIRRSDEPAVFRDFIQRFPNGPRALEAQRRLELLEGAARQREERLRTEERAKQTIEDRKRQKQEADQKRKQDEIRRKEEAATQRKQEEIRKQEQAKAKSNQGNELPPGQVKEPTPPAQQEVALPPQDAPVTEPKSKPERAAPSREKRTASRPPAKRPPVEARRPAPRAKATVSRPARGGGGGGRGGGGGGSGMIGI